MRRTVHWALALMTSAVGVSAQDLAQQSSTLKLIRETAAEICYTVQQEGQQNDKELSGKVQAQLNGVISKVVDLNADMAGKLKSQQYKGVLQEQLATTLKQSADCRKDVFDTLVDRMLPRLPLSSQQPPQSTSRGPLPVTTQIKTQQPIFVFSSKNQPEDEELAEDLASALKGKGFQLASSAKTAALLVDITDASISDRSRVASNGTIVHYATARANVTSTWAANSTPLFSDPAVEEMEQGDNTYDVREKARAAMIEAAVRRFETLSAK